MGMSDHHSSQNGPAAVATVEQAERARIKTLRQILEGGRWAPSGDNVQPWRFEIIDGHRVTVTLHGEDSFYETLWNGKGILLAAGGLLETLRIVASQYGQKFDWQLSTESRPRTLHLQFFEDPSVVIDPLHPVVAVRTVRRHIYRFKPLTPSQRDRLERSVGDEFELIWRESLGRRWQAAWLNLKAADIRLRLRETFDVSQHILDWDEAFSRDRIPVRAIAVDAWTRRLMKFLLKKWARIDFVNRHMGGTILPAIEMDLAPGIACASHFLIRFPSGAKDTTSPHALIRAGQSMQRLWLQATAEGLALQPSMAPILMAGYCVHPDARPELVGASRRLVEMIRAYAEVEPGHVAFMGRIGTPWRQRVTARSVRKTLEELTTSHAPKP